MSEMKYTKNDASVADTALAIQSIAPAPKQISHPVSFKISCS